MEVVLGLWCASALPPLDWCTVVCQGRYLLCTPKVELAIPAGGKRGDFKHAEDCKKEKRLWVIVISGLKRLKL